jgi:hypothetical protein
LNLKCEKVVSKCGFKFNLYRYTSACRAGYRRALFWWDPDQCFACPAGRFNQDDAVDQDGCAACDPGSFAPHAASTRCHLCPSSQFADKAGMDTCDVCTDLSGGDMITVSSGSSSRRQCLVSVPQGHLGKLWRHRRRRVAQRVGRHELDLLHLGNLPP